jgi:glycerophosphoryl diester phosphodiesterase
MRLSLYTAFFAADLLISLTGISQPPALLPKAKHKFIVIAHRGDHTQAPENTLQAYQNAINEGVDYVEIDLRTTKDSQLVIMHDASVYRMTGTKSYVNELSFDSIRSLKVRDTAHANWGSFHIPSFKEVLKLCRNHINIYLDFKNASADAAMKEIVAAGMERHVIVYINTPNQLTDWQKTAPEIPLMLSLPNTYTSKEQVANFVKKYAIALLDGNYNVYTAEMVRAANAQHVAVWPDIQSDNEHLNWDKALLLGIQGLQTDHPRALIDYLKNKKTR